MQCLRQKSGQFSRRTAFIGLNFLDGSDPASRAICQITLGHIQRFTPLADPRSEGKCFDHSLSSEQAIACSIDKLRPTLWRVSNVVLSKYKRVSARYFSCRLRVIGSKTL